MKKYRIDCRVMTGLLLILAFILVNGQTCFCQENNVLVAKGHGFVRFTGNGPLSIGGDGALVVNKNCSVVLPDNSANIDEVERYIRKNAGIVYPNISGKVQIDGKAIEVSFAGANIGLRVEGEGTVVLQGYGMYIDNAGNAGHWTPQGNPITVKSLAIQ